MSRETEALKDAQMLLRDVGEGILVVVKEPWLLCPPNPDSPWDPNEAEGLGTWFLYRACGELALTSPARGWIWRAPTGHLVFVFDLERFGPDNPATYSKDVERLEEVLQDAACSVQTVDATVLWSPGTQLLRIIIPQLSYESTGVEQYIRIPASATLWTPWAKKQKKPRRPQK